MKRTGEILKNERESRGLSLHEIGLSLKINSKILRAIEDGDAAHLPAKTFLRGFVQSYAAYLKLNVDDVLKVFTDEMGTTRPHTSIQELHPETTKVAIQEKITVSVPTALKTKDTVSKKVKKTSLEESSTTKGLIFSLLGVILAGLILVTMKVIDRYQREAQVTAVDVKPIEEEQAPLKGKVFEEKISIAPVETASSEDTISSSTGHSAISLAPELAPTAKSPSVAASVVIPKEVLPIKPTILPPPSVPVVAVAPVVPKPTEAPKPVSVPRAEAPKPTEEKTIKPLELIVEALDSVEIEYTSGSGKVEKIKLEPEQIHTFKSKAGLKLNINNGGAVNMILNGKDLGVPGDLGKSIKLTY